MCSFLVERESKNRDILHFAGRIRGLDNGILHLDGDILEFIQPIQGFEHHILKFMIFKQFNRARMVSVGSPTDTFSVGLFFFTESMLVQVIVLQVESVQINNILDFASQFHVLDKLVLHLDVTILEFVWPIQGFDHHILKFMISKQINPLEMVAVG